MSISQTQQKFRKDVLQRINEYRAAHCTPPLELSRKLSDFAQEWAMYLRENNLLEHRKNLQVGENLYRARGPNLSAKRTVDFWYNEIECYDYNNPDYSPWTGDFTQIVWQTSKKLGVGVAYTPDMIYVVANFEPFGNIVGEFEENVACKLYSL